MELYFCGPATRISYGTRVLQLVGSKPVSFLFEAGLRLRSQQLPQQLQCTCRSQKSRSIERTARLPAKSLRNNYKIFREIVHQKLWKLMSLVCQTFAMIKKTQYATLWSRKSCTCTRLLVHEQVSHLEQNIFADTK